MAQIRDNKGTPDQNATDILMVTSARDSLLCRDSLRSKFGNTTIRVLHLSGTGGTSICAAAKKASGVRLTNFQKKHNCNVNGSGPHNFQHMKKDSPWRQCNPPNSPFNWIHLEYAFDAEFPCAFSKHIMLLRDPWERFRSLLLKSVDPLEKVLNMTRILEGPKDTIRFAEVRVLDNPYIRFILGSYESNQISFGSLASVHVKRAIEIASHFDLIIETRHISTSGPVISQVTGEIFEVGEERIPPKNVHRVQHVDTTLLESLFKKYNVFDQIFFERMRQPKGITPAPLPANKYPTGNSDESHDGIHSRRHAPAPPVLFMFYHKTGSQVSRLLVQESLPPSYSYGDRNRKRQTLCGVHFEARHLYRVTAPDLVGCNSFFLDHTKIIHLVRDPYLMVISSFLYHTQDPTPEPWVMNHTPCVTSNSIVLMAKSLSLSLLPVQKLCERLSNGSTVYYDRLKELPAHDALRLEAARFLISGGVHAGGDLVRMSFNACWLSRSSTNVLTVFMDDWKQDMQREAARIHHLIFGNGTYSEETLLHFSPNQTSNHVTDSLSDQDQRESFMRILAHDPDLGPVLQQVSEGVRRCTHHRR